MDQCPMCGYEPRKKRNREDIHLPTYFVDTFNKRRGDDPRYRGLKPNEDGKLIDTDPQTEDEIGRWK